MTRVLARLKIGNHPGTALQHPGTAVAADRKRARKNNAQNLDRDGPASFVPFLITFRREHQHPLPHRRCFGAFLG